LNKTTKTAKRDVKAGARKVKRAAKSSEKKVKRAAKTATKKVTRAGVRVARTAERKVNTRTADDKTKLKKFAAKLNAQIKTAGNDLKARFQGNKPAQGIDLKKIVNKAVNKTVEKKVSQAVKAEVKTVTKQVVKQQITKVTAASNKKKL